VKNPFPPPPLCRHCTVVLLSLRHHEPPRAPHRRRELPRPPCRCPRLLLCSTTVAPRCSVCTAVEPRAPVSPFLPERPPPLQISQTRHLLTLATVAAHLITVRHGARLPFIFLYKISWKMSIYFSIQNLMENVHGSVDCVHGSRVYRSTTYIKQRSSIHRSAASI
jgi:hypothetical protein